MVCVSVEGEGGSDEGKGRGREREGKRKEWGEGGMGQEEGVLCTLMCSNDGLLSGGREEWREEEVSLSSVISCYRILFYSYIELFVSSFIILLMFYAYFNLNFISFYSYFCVFYSCFKFLYLLYLSQIHLSLDNFSLDYFSVDSLLLYYFSVVHFSVFFICFCTLFCPWSSRTHSAHTPHCLPQRFSHCSS